jgi:electron transport complex protein RnfC
LIMRSFRFSGGVHPHAAKEKTLREPITPAPIPALVIIPLENTDGIRYDAGVRVGNPVKAGQVLARMTEPYSLPVHSPITGRIMAFEDRPHSCGRMMPSLVIQGKGTDDGAGEIIETRNPLDLPAEEMIDRIREAGIVGMGGAGFPTHLKILKFNKHNIQNVILNGIESEPFLAADFRVMMEKTKELLLGLRILMILLRSEKAFIAVGSDKTGLMRYLRKSLGRSRSIKVLPVEMKYPAGSEAQLVEAVTGKRTPSAVNTPDTGCYIQNVSTTVAIAEAVLFRKPLIERVVTIGGSGVKEIRNLRVRIGTPIRSLVEYCGGYTGDVIRLVHGGPMRGRAQATDEPPVMKETTGILVLDEASIPPFPEKSCISCGRCVDCCPMRLYPNRLEHFISHRRLRRAVDSGLLNCLLCGSCGFVCPSKRAVNDRIARGIEEWTRSRHRNQVFV